MRPQAAVSCFWSRDRLLAGVIAFFLAALFAASLRLAAMRIIQVDECNNVFVARMVATGQAKANVGSLDFFQVALAPVVKAATRSIDLFVSARFLMLEVFWLNLALITMACGEKLLSLRGAITFLLVASLAPLWDYGFEIRHDNLLLTGILMIWCMSRFGEMDTWKYAFIGGIAVLLQSLAFKAFVYTVPLSACILLFPKGQTPRRRFEFIAAYIAGALGAAVIIMAIFRFAGVWEMYANGFTGTGGVASAGGRFGISFPLSRLVDQTPLLLAAVSAAAVITVLESVRTRTRFLSWQTSFPEALLFVVALAALVVNPTPFPYNLVNLVPFAFIFALRALREHAVQLCVNGYCLVIVLAVVIFGHLVPFARTTHRHFLMTNSRQERLMGFAEDMTDPKNDPVFEGIGMVPTRSIVNHRSFLHSLNIRSFIEGPGPRLRDYLSENPPAILIPNYRTDWLPEDEHKFIQSRYVKLADDFYVLGCVLPPGGGEINIVHPGRYRISAVQDSNIWGSYENTLREFLKKRKPEVVGAAVDGCSLPEAPVTLAAGTHKLTLNSTNAVAVVWVGPRYAAAPRVGEGDHDALFVNWY